MSSSSDSEHTYDSESSSSSESEVESDEEMKLFRQEFRQQFLDTRVGDKNWNEIERIKNNDEDTFELEIAAVDLTDMSWRLLGRYIANNTHLYNLSLPECGITDEKAAILFGELTNSTSLGRLYLGDGDNEFGIEGVRSMVPLLALIGDRHGQSELYTALIPTAPDLLSYIDRKALIDRTLAKNEEKASVLSHKCAQKVTEYEQRVEEYKKKYEKKMAALKTELLCETSRLTAENNELINRRELIDLGDSKQAAVRAEDEGSGGGGSRGKKRGRS